MTATDHVLLDVRELKVHFAVRRGFLRRTVGQIKAVDGVSFQIRPQTTLGLVGESGCGKTTVGRAIMRIYNPDAGSIHYMQADARNVDLTTLDKWELAPLRQQIRMIFQDPYSSLNPRMTLLDIVGEPLRAGGGLSQREIERRVAEMLQKVGLRPEYVRRYPHAFSGGERQRIVIARALVTRPRLVVADEPVSALDVSVRAQVLNLMRDLQEEYQLTYLFISHDLNVVEFLCDQVAVMYVGKLVELADTAALYAQPRHPYTEALLSAVPRTRPRQRSNRIVLQGEVADPAHPPTGCAFHPRCPYAQELCRVETPALQEVSSGHFSACHFATQLSLQGALKPHGISPNPSPGLLSHPAEDGI